MDRDKEKSGVIAQTSIAIPPVFATDARCSTTGGGVQGTGQRQVGYRLENDIVTWRVANVATVIISSEPITDVKTCNRDVLHQMSKVAEQGTQIEFKLVS